MDSILSSELLDLKTQLDAWRHAHRKRSRIPTHFYQAAVSLLDRHSVSLICRETRLRPASLRQHAGEHLPLAPKSAQQPSAFLRLEAADLAPPRPIPTRPAEKEPPAPHCHLLFERADGSRLTLSLAAADWTRIEALCTYFLRDQ